MHHDGNVEKELNILFVVTRESTKYLCCRLFFHSTTVSYTLYTGHASVKRLRKGQSEQKRALLRPANELWSHSSFSSSGMKYAEGGHHLPSPGACGIPCQHESE